MITEYEVRVRRPWMGVKRGQVIKVNNRRRLQLVRLGMVVAVDQVTAQPEAQVTEKQQHEPASKTVKAAPKTRRKKKAE